MLRRCVVSRRSARGRSFDASPVAWKRSSDRWTSSAAVIRVSANSSVPRSQHANGRCRRKRLRRKGRKKWCGHGQSREQQRVDLGLAHHLVPIAAFRILPAARIIEHSSPAGDRRRKGANAHARIESSPMTQSRLSRHDGPHASQSPRTHLPARDGRIQASRGKG